MVRFIFACFAFSTCFGALAADVDLRRSGALEELQRTNAAHYAKVEQVLDLAQRFPKAGPARWLPASLNASDVRHTRGLLKTSYPPKETLRFRLDEVRYTVDITRHDVRAP